MKIVYYGITGESLMLARRFNCELTSLKDYREDEQKILFISTHIYHNELNALLERFLIYFRDKIVGVIILDDKSFGNTYGEAIEFYKRLKIPILALWDKNVTQIDIENIKKEVSKWK